MNTYDADVLVIGAGPAGMAAAIRVRWVKTSRMAPSSTLLIDPGGLGGIADMGSICLTGPSWAYKGHDMMVNVMADVEHMEIPLVREAAVSLERQGALWAVHTPSRTLRGLAVVVAVGIRRLTNEPELRHAELLKFLSGGYARSEETFTFWSKKRRGQRVVIIGGAQLPKTLPHFLTLDAGRNTVIDLCEPRQQVRGYRRDGETIVIDVEEDGARREIACEMVMLDYHSLELDPPAPAFLPPALRKADGYCALRPDGHPEWPGLYGAGDCTGAPSMSSRAIGQGVEAGFWAYQYTYRRKFGIDPHLFAFIVSPERPPLDAPELPAFDPARHVPIGLTAASRFPKLLEAGVPLATDDLPTLQKEAEKKIATVHLREV
jgi:thioredoxin reductase